MKATIFKCDECGYSIIDDANVVRHVEVKIDSSTVINADLCSDKCAGKFINNMMKVVWPK